MLGNNFGKTSTTYGASKNVWHGKSKVYPVGGTVDNLSDFSAGSIIPAASMAIFDSVHSEVTIVKVASYDATAKYAVGDACIYGGVVYVCNTAISTAEAWTAAHWTKMASISAYSSSATYSVGDLVVYDGELYKNKTAIAVAEAWTAAKWTKLTVATTLYVNLPKVNGLTQHDIVVDAAAKDATYGGATASVVYEGMLFISRLASEIPDSVLANLVGIKVYKEA